MNKQYPLTPDEMNPLLHVFVCTWNEEKIILDFIKWYQNRVPNCKITVFDNYSTDRTTQIALDNGCEVRFFNSGDEMDEQTLVNIRNNCWKESTAKWCLVVDADELVDVNTEFLKTDVSGNIFKCIGYEMFGTEDDNINTLVYGCHSVGYCKPVLFRNWFKEINFAPGSHSCDPQIKSPFGIIWDSTSVNLYHTKWRSWTNGIERAHLLAKRRSEHSKSMGWNIHYEFDDSVHKEYYDNGIKNRIRVR